MRKVETTKQHINLSFLFFAGSLVLLYITAWAISYLNIGWNALFTGVGLMIVAGILHYFAKDYYHFYIMSYVLNMVGSGLSFGSYFTIKEVAFDSKIMIIVMLSGIVIGFVFSRAYMKTEYYNYQNLNLILGLITGFVALIFALFWISGVNTAKNAIMTMMLIYVLIYIGLLNFIVKRGNQYRYISLYSFGIYIVVTSIVLMAVTEGDLFPGDFLSFSGDSSNKRHDQPRV